MSSERLDMHKIFSTEISEIVGKITEKPNIQKVILFGSYAKGNETSDSDIDLCVITDDRRHKIEITWDIREAIFEVAKHSVDLVLYSNSEFNERALSNTTLESQINKTGIVLYG